MLAPWDKLPDHMRTEAVRPYYNSLKKKRMSLIAKRMFDFVAAVVLLIILSPVFFMIAVLIKKDSDGSVFYRQERVTQYGKVFKILKFRTMIRNADKIGAGITVSGDARVTKVGARLRKLRLDELPQLINIITGDMSFVGTRPESVKYTKMYTPEMFATLLLPAGVTSYASIKYKDEAKLLDAAADVDDVYMNQVLPGKMKYNLESLMNFNFFNEVVVMVKTVFAVLH